MGIHSSVTSIRTIISWLFDMELIVIGALEFINVKKRKFKATKLIANYFN